MEAKSHRDILAASAAVAIILIANEEGSATEVTRASSIGCIFFGDCKIKEETNAEARWSKEKNEEDMMIPCALKTGPCDLPNIAAKQRWKRESHDEERKSHDEEFKFAQRIAKNNGLPLPVNHIEDTHVGMSDEDIQESLRREVLRQVNDRAKALTEDNPQHVGKGLLSVGPSKIALLKDHPQSQTQLNGIIDKVKEAQNAKVEASQLTANAQKLQQEAQKAQKQAQARSEAAAGALHAAKTNESKHKNVEKDVRELQARLRFQQQQARAASASLGGEAKRGSLLAIGPRAQYSNNNAYASNLYDDSEALANKYYASHDRYEAAQRETKVQAAKLKALLSQVQGSS